MTPIMRSHSPCTTHYFRTLWELSHNCLIFARMYFLFRTSFACHLWKTYQTPVAESQLSFPTNSKYPASCKRPLKILKTCANTCRFDWQSCCEMFEFVVWIEYSQPFSVLCRNEKKLTFIIQIISHNMQPHLFGQIFPKIDKIIQLLQLLLYLHR